MNTHPGQTQEVDAPEKATSTVGPQGKNVHDGGLASLVEIGGMSKRFGPDTVALDNVSLAIQPGEFFTIIGPSGSGKTTLLRIIGGFEHADSLEVFRLGGHDIADVPAHRRNIATVFQHYALFPHMSVGRNVEYGLKLRGVPAAERRKRALDALRITGLPSFYDRAVGTLSGGERQRVALARVIVIQPALLLLDEPLGALDEKLRTNMQFELKQLQMSLGVTFVYITHNQDEALTMSDRLAVLHDGRLQQVGTPREVYERPKNRFVAEFMGVANLVPGEWAGLLDNGYGEITFEGGGRLKGIYTGTDRPEVGLRVWLSVRPEHLSIDDDASDSPLKGIVTKKAYRGAYIETIVQVSEGLQLTSRGNPSVKSKEIGDSAKLRIDPETTIILSQ